MIKKFERGKKYKFSMTQYHSLYRNEDIPKWAFKLDGEIVRNIKDNIGYLEKHKNFILAIAPEWCIEV